MEFPTMFGCIRFTTIPVKLYVYVERESKPVLVKQDKTKKNKINK